MKNVIITGADGFVGSYTVAHFIKEGCNVLALDMGAEHRRLQSCNQLTYMQCDITDINCMLAKIEKDKYDTFVHFAWAGSAGEARIDYNLQMQNALNTVECMKVAKELGCTRFV
jgi:nucleoside-diphosphate-sugar epimerase